MQKIIIPECRSNFGTMSISAQRDIDRALIAKEITNEERSRELSKLDTMGYEYAHDCRCNRVSRLTTAKREFK